MGSVAVPLTVTSPVVLVDSSIFRSKINSTPGSMVRFPSMRALHDEIGYWKGFQLKSINPGNTFEYVHVSNAGARSDTEPNNAGLQLKGYDIECSIRNCTFDRYEDVGLCLSVHAVTNPATDAGLAAENQFNGENCSGVDCIKRF